VDLSIAIVNYNTKELLEECLHSLLRHPPSCDYEILVIDNASSDGSLDMVRDGFPEVKLTPNPRNVGYAAAVNQAFRSSSSEFVLVLNPDVLVTEGSIDALYAYMRGHPRVGIAGAKLLNPDGSLQYSCRKFYTFKTLLYRRTFLGKIFSGSPVVSEHLMARWDHAEPRQVDWVLGACMMIRRSAVEEVGPADERFFLYFEDVDWCFRMKSRGWEVHYYPDSVMMHHHRRDSAKGFFGPGLRAHLASVFRFYEKWSMLVYLLKRHGAGIGTAEAVIGDAGAVTAAFFAAYVVRQALSFLLKKPLFPLSSYASFLALTIVVALISLSYFGLYRRRYTDWADELVDAGKALSVACVLLMASTFVLYMRSFSRIVLVSFWPISILAVTGLRALVRGATSAAWASGFGARRVLVMGETPARREMESLRAAKGEHLEIVAPPAGLMASARAGDAGAAAAVAAFVGEQRITDVVIASADFQPGPLLELAGGLRGRGVRVRLHTSAAGLLTSRCSVEEFGDAGLIALEESAASPAESAAKRAFDLALGIPAAAALLVYIMINRGLRRSDGDEWVLVRRQLVGRDGRPFDARFLPARDPGDGLPPEPRAKLPLIFSVVRGQLSLVGPKPLTPAAWGSAGSGWKGVRSHLVPGIVGSWSLTRSVDVSSEELEALDRQYLREWSLGHDLKIMIKVLSGG
jgi:GT2 family glycosyltransferase/lipopolysaccharide/colanic/teichoic acid biosynthesis glycosyltransferase